MTIPQTKAEWRRVLRQKRRMAFQTDGKAAARTAARRFLARRLPQKSQNAQYIAAYCAVGSELALDLCWQTLGFSEKNWYFPRLHRDGRLRFQKRAPKMAKTRQNRHHIPENYPNIAKTRHWRNLDVIIVPFVGADLQNYRLGQGGGWYDRSLRWRIASRWSRRPWLIGIGFACQRCATLPHDVWDMRMDAMLWV